MKWILTLFSVAYICMFNVLAQDTLKTDSAIKTNPIIFGEGYVGFSLFSVSGLHGGFSFNYQVKNQLLTLRYTGVSDIKIIVLSPIIPIPVPIDQGHLNEFAVLYGLRSVKEGQSVSFSLGISQNTRVVNYYDANYNLQYQTKKYVVGLPYEFNVKWFKNKKEKYRIYYVIPVGKPTSFGNSVGLKLSGNLSKYSYLALGLSFGLGFHKHY